MSQAPRAIWVDCDNSPHVLYLKAFIKVAKEKGFEVVVTARNQEEIVQLCCEHKLKVKLIGKQTPRNKMLKVISTIRRSLGLYFYLRKQNVTFSISSSRSCAVASYLLRIRSYIITDFEYSDLRIFLKVGSFLIVPSVIPYERLKKWGFSNSKLITFHGYKENFYLDTYPFIKKEQFDLPLKSDEIVAIVRPERRNAHYRTKKTSNTENELWQVFSKVKGVKFIIVPRDKKQREHLKKLISALSINAIVLEKAVDGPSLIKIADMVFSGGGTMARESAVLGTSAYSYFGGKICAVDEYLMQAGLLAFIKDLDDIEKIHWSKKKTHKDLISSDTRSNLVESVWNQIISQ